MLEVKNKSHPFSPEALFQDEVLASFEACFSGWWSF